MRTPETYLAESNSSRFSSNMGSLRYWSKKALRLRNLSYWEIVRPNNCAILVWFAIINPETCRIEGTSCGNNEDI